METPFDPLRPPRRKKGKKRPNLYNDPVTEEPLGIAVHFQDNTLRLPLPLGDPNVLTDNRGFSNSQINYDHLEEHAEDKPILLKTHVKTLPTGVNPNFDTQYDKALHGTYLKEHLKTGHISAATAVKTIAMIKKYWRVFGCHAYMY